MTFAGARAGVFGRARREARVEGGARRRFARASLFGEVTTLTKSGVGAFKGGDYFPRCEGPDRSLGQSTLTTPRSPRAPRMDMADQIGVGLRTVYNDVLSQPVPDRFFELLRQLEDAGGSLKKDAQ